MPTSDDKQDASWYEDPDTMVPGMPVTAWHDFETALRKKEPGEAVSTACEHVVVVYAGTQLGRVFPLVAGVNVIGRAPAVDIALVDEEVSRTHAWITLGSNQDELFLEDQGSTNGTFINGQALRGKVQLAAGDRIAVGNHVLKLVAMDSLERAFHTLLLDQSTRDNLTGLGNRRTTLEELQGRFELGRRHNRPLSVIMCDLDNFKLINDSLGHGAGDFVLSDFGERVRRNLRNTDIAGRIGGEEFLLVLPETDMEGAMLLADRLRMATGDFPFELPTGPITVTCSLGVAQSAPEDRDGGALMARADGALYTAKRQGRNRVVADSPKNG